MPDAGKIAVASLGHAHEGPKHARSKHDIRQHDEGAAKQEERP
jgi:hypothetical protein